MARKLFEITADLLHLQSSIDEDGEIAPELDAWFASLTAEEGVKLDAYINLMRVWAAESAAAKAEAARYTQRAKVRDNRNAQLEARLRLHLESTGRTSIETATGRPIALRLNGGRLPLIIDGDRRATDVEPRFLKMVSSIDTELVRASLEAGEELPFARLGERGQHLRVG